MEQEGLSRREALDETLLAYLTAGWSHEQVAAAAGVSSRTVRRRLSDRDFAAEVARRRPLRLEAVAERLSVVTTDAVAVIAASFESESPAVRLRAADLALTWAMRTRRELDLEARLARLEQPSPVDRTDDNDEVS